MIRLFNKLPYGISSEKDEDMIILNCLFAEPVDKEKPGKDTEISMGINKTAKGSQAPPLPFY